MSPTDLKEKEVEPSLYTPPIDGEAEELNKSFRAPSAADEDLPSGHPSKNRTRKSRFSRKQKGIFGSVLTLFGVGGFGLFGIMTGPLLPVHASQLLQNAHFGPNEFIGRTRVGKLIRYSRTIDEPSRRNMTFLGNRVADRYQGRLRSAGFELNFQRPDGTRARTVQSIRVDTRTQQGRDFVRALHANGVRVADYSTPGRRGFIEIPFDSSVQGRRAINSAVQTLGLSRTSTAIGTRSLKVRGGVNFRPLTNTTRNTGERLRTFITRRNQEVSQDRKQGTRRAPVTIDTATQDPANPDTTRTSDVDARNVAQEVNDTRTADSAARRRALTRTAGRGAGALGLMCLAKGIYDVREQIIMFNVILPLMRIGVEVIAAGDQIRYGQGISDDEVARLVDAFYDEESRTSFLSADPIRALHGEELTGNTIPDYANPASAIERPAFIAAIDNISGINQACTTVTGQVILVVLGGASSIITEGVIQGIRLATGNDPIMAAVEWVARGLAGDEIDDEPAGALYGAYASYGSRLAAIDAAVAAGGRELTPEEESVLAQRASDMYIAEHSIKPLTQRLFDLYDSRSLISKVAYRVNRDGLSITVLANRILSAPYKLTANLFNASIIGQLTMPVTASSNSVYDYGFPLYGFSVDEVEGLLAQRFGLDESDLEPYENAEILEANNGQMLRVLNDEYGECFNTTVNPDTGRIETVQDGAINTFEQDPKCNDRNNLNLLRYRLYLLDQTTLKSIACFEMLDDDACRDVGL